MRVLHTVATIDPASGGPARSVPALVRALKWNGITPVLWTAGRLVPEWTKDLDEDGVAVHTGEPGALGRFDLIHDHGLWLPSNHAVAKFARLTATPRIVSPRGMLEPWALNHKKWKKRLAWALYQRADLHTASALHATAESEAEQFRRLGLKLPVYVVPNGVDLPTSRIGGDPHASITDSPDRFRTALYLSRIHPKKGLLMLIDAWAVVRPAGWKMRVVGPDENGHRAELEMMVKRMGLTASWEFCGPLDGEAKAEEFKKAELFILPTYSENFGIAVAEALAAGVPAITTTGAPWAGLRTTASGWWTNPTAKAIEEALRDACSKDSETLRQMGVRGRDWMERDFTWEGVAIRMAESYEKVLHEQR